jgi:hypothetical protein
VSRNINSSIIANFFFVQEWTRSSLYHASSDNHTRPKDKTPFFCFVVQWFCALLVAHLANQASKDLCWRLIVNKTVTKFPFCFGCDKRLATQSWRRLGSKTNKRCDTRRTAFSKSGGWLQLKKLFLKRCFHTLRNVILCVSNQSCQAALMCHTDSYIVCRYQVLNT